MIEQKSVVDQIEIQRDGFIQVRIAKLVLSDGVEISKQWHRTSLPPGHDIDAQFAAVNSHLAGMGGAVVSADDVERVRSQVQAAWTPAVVEAWEDAARQRQLAADEE